ncbi:MAG: hypothetical protein IKO02_06725 [Lentisphaeria bacterium]|nr:hypothetical protein [Lentisphaeria bacterium]
MKKKTVYISVAFLGFCLLAFVLVLALVLAPRPILIEGTITDDQGNALNGVSACVYFLRPETSLFGGSREDRYTGPKLEETVDSSFHFEGKGDMVYATFGKKGYAPHRLHLGRGDKYNLIRRDLCIVMKERTPEELTESLFQAIDGWSREIDNRTPAEIFIEGLRKAYGLEISDMTDLFVKVIQDHLSGAETKSEDRSREGRHYSAIYFLQYYPLPQEQFLELIRKSAELKPESADRLIRAYTKVYPDWVFDDKTIFELASKSDMKEFGFFEAYADLSRQIREEKDEIRRKKLLDKAFEWVFQDDMLTVFHYLDRLLLDCRRQEYAELPARKMQLEKDLKRHEEAEVYDRVYRRTKYALEHFGEGDEAFEMLYKMDTDPKLWDGEWERSERDKRLKEGFEEAEKRGIDLSTVLGPELYKKYQSYKASEKE